MFSKIVVGIDGLDGGLDALALARALAGPETLIVAVNAFPCDQRPSRGSIVGYEELMRDDALKILHQATGADDTITVHAIGDLSPARALQHEAEHEHADLLVVGSCRHGSVGRVLLGDVSRSVMHGAPCPVAVAPRGFQAGARPPRVIGVGFDDTEQSRAALDLAAQLARERAGELRILMVIESIAAVEEARAHAQERLGEIVEELDVAASADVVEGLPAHELEELSKEVDLIVAGSRGWGAFKAVVLGSTSDRLARNAACPVVVVPSPVADRSREAASATHA